MRKLLYNDSDIVNAEIAASRPNAHLHYIPYHILFYNPIPALPDRVDLCNGINQNLVARFYWIKTLKNEIKRVKQCKFSEEQDRIIHIEQLKAKIKEINKQLDKFAKQNLAQKSQEAQVETLRE